jgi:hypothetical protein
VPGAPASELASPAGPLPGPARRGRAEAGPVGAEPCVGAYHLRELAAWQQQLSPLDQAALEHVRMAVESNLSGRAAAGELRLSARDGEGDSSGSQASPSTPRFDPWAHTMRNPAHRVHVLGHKTSHRGPYTPASLTRAGS